MVDTKQIDETEVVTACSLAKLLAPEEICPGDFVSLLHVFYDLPSFFWDDSAIHRREELVRLCYLPETAGVPLKVIAVCLPFVLAKAPSGAQQPLDVRRVRLARLDAEYAAAAWKLCKKKKPESCKRL